MTVIQGNRFKSLAHHIYAPPRGIVKDNKYRTDLNNMSSGDYRYLANTFDKRRLNNGERIYTHTFYADQLFETIWDLDVSVTVITHNADTPANIEPPLNVKMWYSTNVDIISERVKSIPIGLENDRWLGEKLNKMQKKLQQPKLFRKMLYMNHNISTNPTKRQKPYDVLKGQSFVTTGNGANGEGFDNYLDNLYHHPFVVCPEGNGIDTHRVWECLYMKTIPVVIRNINNSFYADLPILFIDDWDELSEKFLHDNYMRIVNETWNTQKLDFDWWKKELTFIQ